MSDADALARAIIPLLDLTRLDEADSADEVQALCEKAQTPYGQVAGLCILPRWLRLARGWRPDRNVRLVTVANFPDGSANAARTCKTIMQALDEGAEELDVVFPYRAFMEGRHEDVAGFLDRVRRACAENPLKIILETGLLATDDNIKGAAQIAVAHGADFLKTSTGKIPVGATPEAARLLLQVIVESEREVGLKVSGGVRQPADAAEYLAIAQSYLGDEALHPARFRIGASSLLDELLLQSET
jgi:deoxyribose-phosphate aldolase